MPAPLRDVHSASNRLRLLEPRHDRQAVARQACLDTLGAPRTAPIGLVVAPTGYGKSILADQWLLATPGARVRLVIDAEDRDPATLTRALLDVADRLRGTSTPGDHDATAATPSESPGTAVVRAFRGITRPWALAVDDAHLLSDSPSESILHQLLATPFPLGGILVLARTTPGWATDRRFAPRLVTLAAADLAFDQALITRAASLSGRMVDTGAILEQTNGWPAGVRIVLAAGDELGSSELPNDPRAEEALSYYVNEALRPLDARARRAVLVAARLPCACDALLDAIDAPPTSSALPVGTSLFVLDHAVEGWFHIMPIARPMLVRLLTADVGPARVRAYLRKAAGWYAAHDMMSEAVESALLASDPALAANIVERAGFAALADGRWDRLRDALDHLPSGLIETSAALLILRSWRDSNQRAWVNPDDLELARSLLNAVEESTAARLSAHIDAWERLVFFDPGNVPGFLVGIHEATARLRTTDPGPAGIILGLTGVLVGLFAHLDAGLELFAEALDRASPPSPDETAYLLVARGWLLIIAGGASQSAESDLRQATAVTSPQRLPGTFAFASTWLGWLALFRLELDSARDFFRAARAGEPVISLNDWRNLALGTALTSALGGFPDEAPNILDELDARVEGAGNMPMVDGTRAMQARIWLLQNRLDLVRAWMSTIALDAYRETPVIAHSLAITWARGLLAIGHGHDHEQVMTILDQVEAIAAAVRLDRIALEARLCRAYLANACGDRRRALATVEEVVRVAAARNDVFLVVEHGRHIKPLLTSLVRREVEPAFLARALAEIDAIRRRWPDVGCLSPMQQMVLRRLARGDAPADIANEHFVSAETVRSHASHAYRVLGVNNLRDAIVRGRQIGLLVP